MINLKSNLTYLIGDSIINEEEEVSQEKKNHSNLKKKITGEEKTMSAREAVVR